MTTRGIAGLSSTRQVKKVLTYSTVLVSLAKKERSLPLIRESVLQIFGIIEGWLVGRERKNDVISCLFI